MVVVIIAGVVGVDFVITGTVLGLSATILGLFLY